MKPADQAHEMPSAIPEEEARSLLTSTLDRLAVPPELQDAVEREHPVLVDRVLAVAACAAGVVAARAHLPGGAVLVVAYWASKPYGGTHFFLDDRPHHRTHVEAPGWFQPPATELSPCEVSR